MLAATEAARTAVAALLEELGLRPVDLDPADPPATPAGVLVIDGEPAPERWFEIGVAVGALGRRAILTQIGDATVPDEIARLGPIRLDVGDPSQALAERLRRLGLATRSRERRRAH